MKKLSYLFAILGLFAFTACGGGGASEGAAEEATEVAACCCGDAACAGECHSDATEETAEKVGCQVEGGECLADHSCCAAKEESHNHDHEGGDHDHSDGSDHGHDHE
tara:strand:+ start:51573 stop:51893 length:321 start_codon:yes stop_codon:yes gene_type:complete